MIVGTVWSASVAGPVIQVTVPSVCVPASSSIFGPSAATSTGHGDDPAMLKPPLADRVSPENETEPSRISGNRIARYSRMCRSGLSNDMPNMVSITIWCDRPMPSVKRPPVAPWAVERLGRQHHRVPRVGRHDGRAELDAGHLASDHRERGDRVVGEDLRQPERVEALGLGLAGRSDQVVHRAVGCLAAEDSDPHDCPLSCARSVGSHHTGATPSRAREPTCLRFPRSPDRDISATTTFVAGPAPVRAPAQGGRQMKVPLTIRDFLDRAAIVYPDRVAVVDEPDQPAPSWGEMTFRDLAAKARAQAVGLDRLGVGPGERVAMVSQNAARLLTSFWGVGGSGRVFVPINFRLHAAEVSYIVEDSGASVLIVDPELDAALPSVDCKNRFVIGAESDAELFPSDAASPDGTGVEPEPWEPDEDTTATINYTSGTTARPKGVQMTHRNLWLNATTFGWHAGVSDRDVYLHTLPMFHCNGWGMPFATCGMGVNQIVLRKVDGAEILRRVERHGVTLMCGAPAVVASILDAASTWDGEIPGAGRTRIVVAGAPPPTRTIERVETELGWEFIQIYGLTETAPLLTINRSRAEWDDLPVGDRAQKLGRAGAPALGIALDVDDQGEVLARGQPRARGLLGTAGRHRGRDRRRLVPHRRRGQLRRRGLPDDLRPQEGRDHLRRGERVVDRGGGRHLLPSGRGRGGGDRRAAREVG